MLSHTRRSTTGPNPISSLPRMTSMGMDASLDSKDFFEITAMIAAAL